MSISHTLLSQLVTLALDEDLNYQTAADGGGGGGHILWKRHHY